MMPSATSASAQLIDAASRLADAVDQLSFAPPVTHRYNPLRYAWDAHRQYLEKVPDEGTEVLFVGMNPGPWGMAQTGVPFGEVNAARDWLGIEAAVGKPLQEHPKRLVEGFDCRRSEVSGRRLWGLFQQRFGTAERFFARHFVANYCPLVFMEQSGRNRTPDKLPAAEREPLIRACDAHLCQVINALDPKFLVGIGAYAEKCLQRSCGSLDRAATITRILHPSPASPAANRDWAGRATEQLQTAGIWRA